jgi:myo-inositol-1(or 4)-monophosphatase
MAQSAIINVMTAAAIKASRGLLRDFGEVDQLQISKKGPADFVTAADKRAEQQIMYELNKARPGYGFLAEESGEIAGEKSEYRWIIDPLDGTHNFIHAIPYFCISIALERTLASGKTEIVAGVVYDPIHNEMFTAEKGQGALLNGNRKLACSQRNEFEASMIVITAPRKTHFLQMTGKQAMERVLSTNASVRYIGASALDLAYLAAGRVDAVCLMQQRPWDVAAAWLLIQEAGGLVTTLDGRSYDLSEKNMLASNAPLQAPLLKLLAD